MSKRKKPMSEMARVRLAMHADPDFQLRIALNAMAYTDNPYYAWEAIGVCIEHNKDFPDWLTCYLAQCVTRMQSDRARKTADLRKALPWIFGFPEKKCGPGNLLEPDYDPRGDDKDMFALKFATRLALGEVDPVKALHDASSEVFANGHDDKTLWRWLLQHFDVATRPQTAAEWHAIARKYYSATWALIDEYAARYAARA